MGNCLGKPEPAQSSQANKPSSANTSTKSGGRGGGTTAAKPKKDWGLGERYEMIKFLGYVV